jgi:hypothetical protein
VTKIEAQDGYRGRFPLILNVVSLSSEPDICTYERLHTVGNQPNGSTILKHWEVMSSIRWLMMPAIVEPTWLNGTSITSKATDAPLTLIVLTKIGTYLSE